MLNNLKHTKDLVVHELVSLKTVGVEGYNALMVKYVDGKEEEYNFYISREQLHELMRSEPLWVNQRLMNSLVKGSEQVKSDTTLEELGLTEQLRGIMNAYAIRIPRYLLEGVTLVSHLSKARLYRIRTGLDESVLEEELKAIREDLHNYCSRQALNPSADNFNLVYTLIVQEVFREIYEEIPRVYIEYYTGKSKQEYEGVREGLHTLDENLYRLTEELIKGYNLEIDVADYDKVNLIQQIKQSIIKIVKQ